MGKNKLNLYFKLLFKLGYFYKAQYTVPFNKRGLKKTAKSVYCFSSTNMVWSTKHIPT